MQEKIILLVEDNPDDEELTLLAFRKNNILNRIVVARDGDEAIRLLFGGDGAGEMLRPAIILLDLKLPKMDGLEVLRRIRGDARTKMLPVVDCAIEGEAIEASASPRKPSVATFSRSVSEAIFEAIEWMMRRGRR